MTTETAPELSGPAAPGVPTTHSHEEAGSVMYGCAGFVLDGSSDRVTEVGPPIVLTRGVLAEITVVNHLDEPTAVHWHGIELESLFDGVPGWAGLGSQLAPEIPPGGSFVARMTPPRASTFTYHTHWHDVAQLTGGLYGPLIVLEPGESFDPNVDRIFLIGRAGPDAFHDPLVLNGRAQPGELALSGNTRYRFLFINITPNDSYLTVSLVRDGKPVLWQPLAKEGAALPPAQAAARPATQVITVGEPWDFRFVPDGGAVYELSVAMPPAPPAQKVTQIILVGKQPAQPACYASGSWRTCVPVRSPDANRWPAKKPTVLRA